MEQALLDLLRKLESIEADHDGLGDTNVREHMSVDVFRGFLQPNPGFSPSGDYGLSAEANALVGDVLRRFCTEATEAAKREGLRTFNQRFSAFQNADVQTAGGADFEDYFGYQDPDWFDESGNHRQHVPVAKVATSATIKPVRRAYVFDRPGSLDALLEAFNRHGSWSWQA